MYNGIDVSKWQGKINWSKAKKSIDFAIIRAGYGKGNVDEYANYNIEQCENIKSLTGFIGSPMHITRIWRNVKQIIYCE